MNRSELNEYIQGIEELSEEYMDLARDHWDHLTHPVGSLGDLESLSIRLAGIQQRKIPQVTKKSILVFCADNGVVEENIASSPQNFTQLLANSMVGGGTGVSALADYAKAEVVVVDVGMREDIPLVDEVVKKKVRPGTENFYLRPAMTVEDAIAGIQAGIEVAEEAIKNGADLLGTGELGIGNTTTSSAILHAFTGFPAKDCVGYGAGIDEEQYAKKVKVVAEGVKKHIQPEDGPLEILAKVGGLDIAGLVGVYLAGAKHRVGVVIDGLIASCAAMIAVKLNERVKGYIFASHLSREKAAPVLLGAMGIRPPVSLGMRLGEGSGCPFTFLILEAAIHCMETMASYDSQGIDVKLQVDIRHMDDPQ